MPCLTPFTSTIALLVIATAIGTVKAAYPEFRYTDHPLYTLTRLNLNPPTPVILHKYHFKQRNPISGRDRLTSEDGIFVPGGATYTFAGSANLFCDGADVLSTPVLPRSTVNKNDYISVHLNRPAKMYVLLGVTQSVAGRPYSEQAIPDNWKYVDVVEHPDGVNHYLGDTNRWPGSRPYLAYRAIAMEVPVPASNIVLLPHPQYMKVFGRAVRHLSVVFAPTGSTFPIAGHPIPGLPAPFSPYYGGTGADIDPAADRPEPNESCPQWLHDTHVVADSISYWRTWHLPIDPIYWCYYDHEHGAYPGNYRPRFHFTSYHTPDGSTPNGRQDESHKGFKVFPFYVADGRIVVMTLHVHMSRARRFHARHHTFIFSVHREVGGGWDMEAELFMKMDFGSLQGLVAGGGEEPFLVDQIGINNQLNAVRKKAFRVVYVMNADDWPNNRDMRFWASGDPGATLQDALVGRYEEWRGAMNCALNPVDYNSGFKFEMHEQQTAMKYADSTSADNQQRLRGDGMRRSIVFVAREPGHQYSDVGVEHCSFESGNVADRAMDGTFYTDAYFESLVASTSSMALKQFIKKDFVTIRIGDNRAVSSFDPWYGIMEYSPNMVPAMSNTEYSISVMDN